MDVIRLLGMIGYFREYIPNFCKTAESLYVILKKIDDQNNSLKCLISWGETQQEALDQFLLCLLLFEFEFEFVEPPIITYPDHNKELYYMLTFQIKGWELSY